MQTKQCESHCPKCNSDNIDWELWDYTDDESFIKGTCLECGCQFREWRGYKETEWDDEVSCETCRKCGETICGNDTEFLRCWEEK